MNLFFHESLVAPVLKNRGGERGFRSPVSAHPIRDMCNMAMVDFSVGDMEVIFRGG